MVLAARPFLADAEFVPKASESCARRRSVPHRPQPGRSMRPPAKTALACGTSGLAIETELVMQPVFKSRSLWWAQAGLHFAARTLAERPPRHPDRPKRQAGQRPGINLPAKCPARKSSDVAEYFEDRGLPGLTSAGDRRSQELLAYF